MNNIDLKKNYYYKIKLADNSPAFFGMFYSNEPNTGNLMFIYNVSTDHPGQLIKDAITIAPSSSIEYISHEDWIHVMLTLISNGYYFEESIGINLIHKPLPGEITYFYNIVSGESGYGAYQPSPDDKVYMYTYYSHNGVFYKDLSYEVGDKSNTYLKKASRDKREYYNVILFPYGKQWSYAKRRILPLNIYRAKKNEIYYYINDRFTISYREEQMTGVDNNRFNAGNYFLTEVEAQEVLQQFNKILMKRQANENIEQDKTEVPNISLLLSTDEKGKIVKRKRGRPRKDE